MNNYLYPVGKSFKVSEEDPKIFSLAYIRRYLEIENTNRTPKKTELQELNRLRRSLAKEAGHQECIIEADEDTLTITLL